MPQNIRMINARGGVVHLASEYDGLVKKGGHLGNVIKRIAERQVNRGLHVNVFIPFSPEMDLSGFDGTDERFSTKTIKGVDVHVVRPGLSSLYPEGDGALKEYESFARGFIEIISRPDFGRIGVIHAHDYGMGFVLSCMRDIKTRKVFTMYDPDRCDSMFPFGQDQRAIYHNPHNGYAHNGRISGVKAGVISADLCTIWSKQWMDDLMRGTYGGFMEHEFQKGMRPFHISRDWEPKLTPADLSMQDIDEFTKAYAHALYDVISSTSYTLGIGQEKAEEHTDITQINFGNVACDEITFGPRRVLLPQEFRYLLSDSHGIPWYKMPVEWQQKRFDDILQLDWGVIKFIQELIRRGEAPKISHTRIKVIRPDGNEMCELDSLKREARYARNGEKIIRSGKLARVTLAAGAAERFKKEGDERPKALHEISEREGLSDKTFLSVQAEDIIRTQNEFGAAIPWLLFINPLCRDMFLRYFKEQKYFGLDPENILFVEHTGKVPKFTTGESARIALECDREGGNTRSEKIEFATSGHGFFAQAFRRNPIIRSDGSETKVTPFEELNKRKIQYLFQSNIDNLGAQISTRDYRIILGYFYDKNSDGKGKWKILVEMTTPLIGEIDGKKFFWDKGGFALRLDGEPIILDDNVLENETIAQVRNVDDPMPFNTANATYGIDSIPERLLLPPTMLPRKGLQGFETNFWNITGFIPTCFLRVPRQIPESLAQLPPSGGKLVNREPESGTGPIRNRLIPTKEMDHREHAAALYQAITSNPV